MIGTHEYEMAWGLMQTHKMPVDGEEVSPGAVYSRPPVLSIDGFFCVGPGVWDVELTTAAGEELTFEARWAYQDTYPVLTTSVEVDDDVRAALLDHMWRWVDERVQ